MGMRSGPLHVMPTLYTTSKGALIIRGLCVWIGLGKRCTCQESQEVISIPMFVGMASHSWLFIDGVKAIYMT